MSCPICDQKPANCDCTKIDLRHHDEMEKLRAEVERLRQAKLTDQEFDAIDRCEWLLRDLGEKAPADLIAAFLRRNDGAE